MSKILKGLCLCGCGKETTIARENNERFGWVKGEPLRFIRGHNNRHLKGERARHWKGGRKICRGYVLIHCPDHLRANKQGYVLEHILIAEKALGKPIKEPIQIHHYSPVELVICENDSYHKLLHQRQRAYEDCGHANWRKCSHCKKYDDPKNMVWGSKKQCNMVHRQCHINYMINYHNR